jgi:hypothetical protein
MEHTEYLDNFELALIDKLVRLCRSYNKLQNVMPSSEDIDSLWPALAPEYLADAIEQVRDYPTVSVAWAAYMGMAIAHGWDTDWSRTAHISYKELYGQRGFDDMDEHIIAHILGIELSSNTARDIEDMTRRCGELTVDLIRHEQVEPQSPLAYHIFVRACRAMYRIGAALELERLGYKMQPMGFPGAMPS